MHHLLLLQLHLDLDYLRHLLLHLHLWLDREMDLDLVLKFLHHYLVGDLLGEYYLIHLQLH